MNARSRSSTSQARRANKGVACVVVVDLAHDVPEFIVDLLSLFVLRPSTPSPEFLGRRSAKRRLVQEILGDTDHCDEHHEGDEVHAVHHSQM